MMHLQQQLNRFAGKLDPPYQFAAVTSGVLDAATAAAAVMVLSFELQARAVRHEIAGDAVKAAAAKVEMIALHQRVESEGVARAISSMNQVELVARIKALADELKLPAAGAGSGSNRTAVILGVGMAIAGLAIGAAYLMHRQRAQRERGVISGGKPLTTKQIEALKRLRSGPASPWDFGSTTVSRLRKEGLVENDRSSGANRLVITEAGRRLLGS